MTRPMAECVECRRVKPVAARNMCSMCYSRQRGKRTLKCPECYRREPIKGRGLCSTCYRRWRGADRPNTPIVYLFKDTSGTVIYAGRGNGHRTRDHFQDPWWREVDQVLIRRCADYGESLVIESMFIRKYRPRHNIVGVTR